MVLTSLLVKQPIDTKGTWQRLVNIQIDGLGLLGDVGTLLDESALN